MSRSFNHCLAPICVSMLLTGCTPIVPHSGPFLPAHDGLGLAAMDTAVRSGKYGLVQAILIERGGETLFEAYYGAARPESRIDAKSTGKSITALAVGSAIDDGALSGVDDLVWGLVMDEPSGLVQDELKRTIRVEDLLTMSSPLACNDWDAGSPGHEERMYQTQDWSHFALSIPIDPASNKPDGDGYRFSYCTAGVYLLGQAVERATGDPFDSYVQRKLFDPLGIDGAIWRRSPSGQVQSGGQLSLRARDFARLGRMVMNGGEYGGRQVISRDWLRQVLTPRVPITTNMSYGYLWWMRAFSGRDGEAAGGAFMQGNGGNMVLMLPELDAVIVILSQSYNHPQAHEWSTTLVETHILPVLSDANEGRRE